MGNSRGALGVSSDRNVLLVQGFTVGLKLGSRSSLGISLDGRVGLGGKRGLGEDGNDVWRFSSETDLIENSTRELDASSDWNVLLDRGFTVELDQEWRSTSGISLDGKRVVESEEGSEEDGGDV